MSRRLVIYHTSDIHARRGFGARLASIVEPGSLLMDSGDALAGSSTLYLPREPVTAELAKAGYAAMALGNREFHYVYSALRARAKHLPMPLVCSNVIDLRSRPALFRRELFLDVGGQSVRIVAALAPQYRTGSNWERVFGWRFLAPRVALEDLLTREPSTLPTILLSHLGLEEDREIAERVSSLSAILGGHTHAVLEQPEVVSGVPIAHVGAFARFTGRLELSLDGTRPRVESYRLMPLLA